jgi:hypothetical protein
VVDECLQGFRAGCETVEPVRMWFCTCCVHCIAAAPAIATVASLQQKLLISGSSSCFW